MADVAQDVQIIPGWANAASSSPAAAGTGDSLEPDYANMRGITVAGNAVLSAPRSFARQLSNLEEAILHPIDTAKAIGNVVYGAGSKLGVVGEQTPEAKAKNEEAINAVGHDYSNRYGSWAGFAKGMSTDPFAYGMDVGVLAPGVGAGLRVAGMPALATAARATRFLDPTQAALTIAGKGISAAPRVLGTVTGIESGVPSRTMRYAAEAGASTDPAVRGAFRRFRNGAGDLSEIGDAARGALDEIKQNATQRYQQGLNTIQQAFANQAVPYTSIDRSLAEARQIVNPHGQPVSDPARRTLQHVESFINGGQSELTGQNYVGWRNLPHEAQTMMGLDKLKQSIGSLRYDRAGLDSFQRKALNAVYDGVRNSIVDADNRIITLAGPGGQRSSYAQAMEAWQHHLDTVNDWSRTLGAGDRTAEASRISKLLAAPKKGERAAILEAMAETKAGKLLPSMIAGATTASGGADVMHSIMSGLAAAGVYGAMSHPFAIPAAVATAALGSPKVAGKLAYMAGSARRPLNYAREAVPSLRLPQGVSDALAVYSPRRAIDILPNIAARGAAEVNREGARSQQGRFNPDAGYGQVFDLTGDGANRPGRASGGSVNATHERLVNRLMTLSDQAKKATSQKTKTLLNVDDSTIARALQVADNAI